MSQPPKRFHIYKDAAGEWRWSLHASGNHEPIADSGEGYKNKQDCIAGARLVASTATDAMMWDVAAGQYI
jgi:uncharacterized protein YegP (UPF0339 family)